ncbi:alpha/beta-hydrolase [Polyporus arcularius HHB13444]|uniref:Alpha/beta-hydrolase n=1 Tax=Polyporus arcularius HHB13444 TaxID=1314778 RepID=A0A5C3PWJ2_9APHY|nr:alpha/beta-hydrolase [Polyporus arcularius HHB13444]
MDPAKYKDVRVTRGLTYHYYHSPAAPGKPTLLFIHGFPSSSFDWHRQVAHFEPKGYGLIIPDTLGYGGTSKPQEPEAFRWKLQAQDLVDVLDAESPATVIGIGHDWGSAILSALAQWHQDRFAGFVWTALGLVPPRTEEFVLQEAWQTMRKLVGSDVLGYWEFYNEPNAHVVCEKNIDSFLQLAYPSTPEVWIEHLTDAGKAKAWIESNREPGRAPWLTEQEYDTMRETLLKGGLQSPMNVYKALVANINLQDHRDLPAENWYVKKPALFVAATRDYVCRAAFQKAIMQKYAPHAEIVALDTGHWVQLEATEGLNGALEKWIETFHAQ